MFSPESSAWQNGYEAGIRKATHGTALKGHQMTAEEAILHIKKVVNAFFEEYDDMGIVEQMRHGGDMAENAMHDIRHIVDEVNP